MELEELKETISGNEKSSALRIVGKYLWVFELMLIAVYIIALISGITITNTSLPTGLLAVFAVIYLIAGIWAKEENSRRGLSFFITSGGLVILSFALLGLIYYFQGWPMANAILIILAIGLIVIVLLSLTTLKPEKATIRQKLMTARFLVVTVLLLFILLLDFLKS